MSLNFIFSLKGAYASTDTCGNAITVTPINNRDQCFMTSGECNMMVWTINPEIRKIHGVPIKVGKLRRSINCV